MHAVQVTHLLHHRHCLREDDVESRSARMPWWQSVLTGPCFPFWVLRKAWQAARPYQRRWIALEVGYTEILMGLPEGASHSVGQPFLEACLSPARHEKRHSSSSLCLCGPLPPEEAECRS